MSETNIQTINITDTNFKLVNATVFYIARRVRLKMVVANKKETKSLGGKGESKTLLHAQSYGGTSTSRKDLNKENLKGGENTPSCKGSRISNRKEKGL